MAPLLHVPGAPPLVLNNECLKEIPFDEPGQLKAVPLQTEEGCQNYPQLYRYSSPPLQDRRIVCLNPPSLTGKNHWLQNLEETPQDCLATAFTQKTSHFKVHLSKCIIITWQ